MHFSADSGNGLSAEKLKKMNNIKEIGKFFGGLNKGFYGKETYKEKLCVCGDEESQHVDNQEQCAVCGCKGFEEPENL